MWIAKSKMKQYRQLQVKFKMLNSLFKFWAYISLQLSGIFE
jgi:hypothetical protein